MQHMKLTRQLQASFPAYSPLGHQVGVTSGRQSCLWMQMSRGQRILHVDRSRLSCSLPKCELLSGELYRIFYTLRIPSYSTFSVQKVKYQGTRRDKGNLPKPTNHSADRRPYAIFAVLEVILSLRISRSLSFYLSKRIFSREKQVARCVELFVLRVFILSTGFCFHFSCS